MIAETWVQTRSGAWHGWQSGRSSSLCEQLSLVDIAREPLLGTSNVPPEGANGQRCEKCWSKSTCNESVRARHISSQWAGIVRLRAKRERVGAIKNEGVEDFADVLTRLGAPDGGNEPEFETLAQLVMKPVTFEAPNKRIVRSLLAFQEAVNWLPPNREKLLRIIRAVDLWKKLTERTLKRDRFNPVDVIRVMRDIPDPIEEYVTQVVRQFSKKGAPHFAAVFHPNTLERASKDPALRRMFWRVNNHSRDDYLEGVEII